MELHSHLSWFSTSERLTELRQSHNEMFINASFAILNGRITIASEDVKDDNCE